VWDSVDALRTTWRLADRFEPTADRTGPDAAYERWREAVHRAGSWATD
jgi:glycerol kinase